MKNLTILSLVNLAIKHILLIIAVAVVFAAGAFSYCEFIAEPQYSAKGSILITNGSVFTDEAGNKTSISATDITASRNISYTVIDMLKTSDFLIDVEKVIDHRYSYKRLSNFINIKTREGGTLFLDISVTSTTPDESIELLNIYLSLIPDFISEALPGVNVKVFNATSAPKVYPRTSSTTLFAAMLGAVAAYGVLFIIALLDTIIHDEDDFKAKFDIPVIGSVPDFTTANGKAYKSYGYGGYDKGGSNNG